MTMLWRRTQSRGRREDGVQILGSDRNQVLGNSISGGARDGIRLDSVDSILCDDNKIDGNTSINNTRWGININHPLCHNTVVGTNTLTGNGSGAIRDMGAGLAGDFDLDLVTDIAEANCGSNPGDAAKRPERTDLPGDDDGDGQSNEALPAGAITFDCDGDGWNGKPESGTPLCGDGQSDDGFEDLVVDDGCPGGPVQTGAYSEGAFNIGTSDQDSCGNNGWPAELSSGGVSANKLTLGDITSFVAPLPRKLDKRPGEAGFVQRWDLVPGPVAATSKWITLTDLVALTAPAVATANPPMLGSVRAFDGPACPWP